MMSPGSYLPIIDLRPAEMLALGELPQKDRDALKPLFRLRPWSSSNLLEKSIARIKKSFGNRPCFLEVAEEEAIDPDKRRAVHAEIEALRLSAGGYSHWLEYLTLPEHAQFVPALQIGGTAAEFGQQIVSLYALGRGLLVRLELPRRENVEALCALVAPRTSNGVGVTVVLDYGKQDGRFSSAEQSVRDHIQVVRENCISARCAISASSFPESFVGIQEQPIHERMVFNRLSKSYPELIYSDRGGARAEKQIGGGGLPAPRIDYAKKNSWHFFRQSAPSGSTFDGYQNQAIAALRSEFWDKKLKLWGCQMIERTAAGDSQGGITSANRSTAVRLNLHLHRQLYYGDETSFLDTDEEWSD
jgi:hypothetical protein